MVYKGPVSVALQRRDVDQIRLGQMFSKALNRSRLYSVIGVTFNITRPVVNRVSSSSNLLHCDALRSCSAWGGHRKVMVLFLN